MAVGRDRARGRTGPSGLRERLWGPAGLVPALGVPGGEGSFGCDESGRQNAGARAGAGLGIRARAIAEVRGRDARGSFCAFAQCRTLPSPPLAVSGLAYFEAAETGLLLSVLVRSYRLRLSVVDPTSKGERV